MYHLPPLMIFRRDIAADMITCHYLYFDADAADAAFDALSYGYAMMPFDACIF